MKLINLSVHRLNVGYLMVMFIFLAGNEASEDDRVTYTPMLYGMENQTEFLGKIINE